MTMLTTGSKYEAVKSLKTSEIAKLFRADVKVALKEKKLPTGLSLGVRTRTFAGGSAIDVVIKAAPGVAILNPAYVEKARNGTLYQSYGTPILTGEAKTLLDTLQGMLDAYNRQDVDSQSDYFNVRFYSDVQYDNELTRIAR